MSQPVYVQLGISIITHPDSSQFAGIDLGVGSLPPAPRLGALPAVPRHPVRALAHHPAVVRAGAAGGTAGAALEVLPPSWHRRRQAGGRQAAGRHAATAATHQAQHRQRLHKCGIVLGATARNVERGGPRSDPLSGVRGYFRAVGALRQRHRDKHSTGIGT
jgi:hypothetical protein